MGIVQRNTDNIENNISSRYRLIDANSLRIYDATNKETIEIQLI